MAEIRRPRVENLEPIGFDGVSPYLVEKGDQVRNDLATYFSRYTGRFFEVFSRASPPDRFDGNDLAACACLSVPITGPTLDRLWSNIETFDELLRRCPDEHVGLADVDQESDEYQSLVTLYDGIRAISGMGRVRTSKLLASKRPALVPIRDSYVETLLGQPDQWWTPWRELIRTDGIGALLDELTPPEAEHVSTLRRLDVALWMEAERRLQPSTTDRWTSDRSDVVVVPRADASWDVIAEFALSYNAYERLGGFDQVGKTANSAAARYRQSGQLPSTFDEIRTCLFFEQRRWRHFAEDPNEQTRTYISRLIERLHELTGGLIEEAPDPLP